MPVDSIFAEFAADLSQYEKTIDGLEAAAQFCTVVPQEFEDTDAERAAFLIAANQANEALRGAQGGMPVLRGAMFAQTISRFEIFVRNEIEDLAVRASSNAAKYSHLPKDVRSNLLIHATMVLANPKKFHMETFVRSIASTLADNLNDISDPGIINQYCISLTSENMRSSTVDELFKRVGIADIWPRIGANVDVQIVSQQPDPVQAASTCQKRLNVAIDRRNQIIHPPTGITWPGPDEVKNLISLLRALGEAISSNIPVFEMRLKTLSDTAALNGAQGEAVQGP